MSHLTRLFNTLDNIETDPTLTEEQRNALLEMQYRNLAYCLQEGIIPVKGNPAILKEAQQAGSRP